jgi:hypothetical protein
MGGGWAAVPMRLARDLREDAVNWPRHIFVNQDFKVVGAD